MCANLFSPCDIGMVGPDGGFSSRYVYDTKRIKQLSCHQGVTGEFGTDGDSHYVPDFEFRKNQTYTIKLRVKMNTPGQEDGDIKTYINGVNEFIFVLLASDNAGALANPSTIYLDDITLSTERVVTLQ
jgi:hypothetical protein